MSGVAGRETQHLVLFSRLGPHDRSLLDEVVYRRREFTEQCGAPCPVVGRDGVVPSRRRARP